MKKSIVRSSVRLALAAALGLPLLAARGAGAEERRPPPREPPAAAFEACGSKAQGDRCEVTFHEHTITGTCAKWPSDDRLVCRPDHPPGPPPGEGRSGDQPSP